MVSADIIQCTVVASLCFFMIMIRTTYRIFCRCQVHTKCHRKWHKDDIWMTFAILPLVGRAVTIAWSASLLHFPSDFTALQKKEAKTLNGKLLMAGRIFYLSFLWCCKFCLLELYMRLAKGLPKYRLFGEIIRYSLFLTYIGVCLATTLECRPIAIAWNGDASGTYCRKARANLITMASCNMATDIALIIFPISILKRSGLDFYRLLRLSLLFALGSLVILTTVIRLPLILRDDAQKTRSLWASIEISVACFIAQAPFFQAVYVDRKMGQHSNLATAYSFNHGTQLQSRSHITARGGKNESALDRKQEDEIGLWTIEKRVSFSVEGAASERRGSSVELATMGSGDRRGEGMQGNGAHVEVVNGDMERGREGSNQNQNHEVLRKGSVTTTVIDGGFGSNKRNSSRNHMR